MAEQIADEQADGGTSMHTNLNADRPMLTDGWTEGRGGKHTSKLFVYFLLPRLSLLSPSLLMFVCPPERQMVRTSDRHTMRRTSRLKLTKIHRRMGKLIEGYIYL